MKKDKWGKRIVIPSEDQPEKEPHINGYVAPFSNFTTTAQANVENKAKAYDDYVKAGYTPSETVNYWKGETDSRYDAVKDYAPYNNPNAAAMQAAMDAIVSRPAFSFSADGDALYEQYKNNYINAGKRAMEDTMGAAASLSGGYGNSYAAAAAAQAYNDYISHINDIVPTLYNMHLQKYNTEGDRLKTNYSIYADQDDRDYGRWAAERENNYALLNAANGRYSGEQNTDIALWQDRGANLANAYNMAQGIYGNAADAERFRINTAQAIGDTGALGAYGYDTSYMGTKQDQDIRQGEQAIKIGDQEIEMNGLDIEQKKRLGEIQDAVDKWTYTKDPSGFKALGWDTSSLEYYSGIEKQTAALSMYDATGNVGYLTEAGIDPTNLEQARKTAQAVENYQITGDPQYLTDAGLNAAYIVEAKEKEDAVFKAQYNDYSGLADLGVNTDFLTKMQNAELYNAYNSGRTGGGNYNPGGDNTEETEYVKWDDLAKSDKDIFKKLGEDKNFGKVIDKIVELEENGGDYSGVLNYIADMYGYDFEPWFDGYEIKNDWNTQSQYQNRPVYVNSQGLIWDIQKKRIIDKYGNVIRENYTGTVLKKPGDLGGGTMNNQTK